MLSVSHNVSHRAFCFLKSLSKCIPVRLGKKHVHLGNLKAQNKMVQNSIHLTHTDSKIEYTFVCMHTNDFVIQVSSHLHGVFAKGTKSDEWWLHVSNFSL